MPVVMTTAPARSSRPLAVTTPAAAPSFTSRSSTGSAMTSRLACSRSAACICQAIELAVGLGARPLHGRTLGAVQHAELDAGLVDDAAHQPVERIDLAHEMPLAEAADGRVARHLADGLELVRDQRRARAHTRRRRRCLAARVPASHNDDVEDSLFQTFLLERAICVPALPKSKRVTPGKVFAIFAGSAAKGSI